MDIGCGSGPSDQAALPMASCDRKSSGLDSSTAEMTTPHDLQQRLLESEGIQLNVKVADCKIRNFSSGRRTGVSTPMLLAITPRCSWVT